MPSNNSISFLCLLLILPLLFFLFITNAQATDKGAQLYLGNCAKCHGREGEGFLKLYPPIHDSKYLKEDVSKLPCIIRNGLKGEITIGTTTFNQIMPAIQMLPPEQMSHIITFMQRKWRHPVTKLSVDKWLKECSAY